jgi:hypothetical protein
MSRKANLPILDGHASHYSFPELFKFAKENEFIMLIVPSHSTTELQPLDRGNFGPFKTYLNKMLTTGSTTIRIEK